MDRTRSQSRFPPTIQGTTIPEEFPESTLDRNNRSKSLDNRRAFLSPQSNETYQQSQQGGQSIKQGSFTPTIARRRYYGNSGAFSGRDNFLNDAITIQKKPSSRQYRSAVDLNTKSQGNENEDNLWTSYDKTVRYNHERVNYPLKNLTQRNQYYDGYSKDGAEGPLITYPESRYPESSDYVPQNSAYNRTNTTNYSHAYRNGAGTHQQQQEAYRNATQDQFRASAGGRGYQQSDLIGRQPAYDEEYVGDSTFDRRTLGESTDARHQREYQQYNKQHQEALSGIRNSRQQQKAAANGYSQHSYHRRHASAGGGGGGGQTGFWIGGSKSYNGYNNRTTGGPKNVVHHRVRCCCLNFMWPPWGYERCEPPQPMFYIPPNSNSYHHNKVRTTTRSGNGTALLSPLQPINNANIPAPTTSVADPNYTHSPSHRY